MEDRDEAAEEFESPADNLRVIRRLMERATVYRAISATPALVGGVLAVLVASVLGLNFESVGSKVFVFSWLGALMVIDGLNTTLLYRDSKKRGTEFPSPQMIHGVLTLAPPMVVGGCVGLVLAWVHGEFERCATIWAISYGLGLLATSSFAPSSIVRLGWAFLVAGFGFFLWHEFDWGGLPADPVQRSSLFMAVTFGGLHLAYAFRTGWSEYRAE